MRRKSVLRAIVVALLVTAPALSAEPASNCPDPEPTACGRYQFEAGTAAFERGAFDEAAGRFRAALAARPHPVIRFNLALALLRLGQPSAALSELGQVLAAPEADKDLKARAERERRGAEQAQSHVSFSLSDPTRERVELDGTMVALAGQRELVLDPGSHHVRVIPNDAVVLDQELELSPGERVELRVGGRARRIEVVVVPDAPARSAPLPSKPPPPRRTALDPAWFYAGLGATAVLTGVTVWSGLDTQSAYSDYQRDLPGLTQAQADARVSSGHSLELRTNLLLAASLVSLAGSAVLGVWFVDFSGRKTTSLGIGPGAVTVSSRF